MMNLAQTQGNYNNENRNHFEFLFQKVNMKKFLFVLIFLFFRVANRYKKLK